VLSWVAIARLAEYVVTKLSGTYTTLDGFTITDS
jgi:hypothetical protein